MPHNRPCSGQRTRVPALIAHRPSPIALRALCRMYKNHYARPFFCSSFSSLFLLTLKLLSPPFPCPSLRSFAQQNRTTAPPHHSTATAQPRILEVRLGCDEEDAQDPEKSDTGSIRADAGYVVGGICAGRNGSTHNGNRLDAITDTTVAPRCCN